VLGEESYVLEPDRDSLRREGFTIDMVANQIRGYLRGEQPDQVKLNEGEMAVVVSSPRAEREGLEGLLNLPMVPQGGSAAGAQPLRHLVTLRRERGVREVMRVNQERTLLVMADLDGIRYGEGVRRVRRAVETLPWRLDTNWNMSGEETQRRESFQKLLFALAIAVVLVYMVIASILESIIHPFTIMVSVPFALTGVVAAFRFADISLNLMGLIGVVMLTGIVVNNAIVLLARIRQIRLEKDATSVAEAVVAGARQRLRPIVMTSLTTILALLPLALGFGNGAELRRPLAVAVIGGLASSTLLTLWILPALYVCVEDVLAVLRKLLGRRGPREDKA
jgi:hydrophobic/amphiphilic exporter-1 (mainly G- bacteria), HAE1 family